LLDVLRMFFRYVQLSIIQQHMQYTWYKVCPQNFPLLTYSIWFFYNFCQKCYWESKKSEVLYFSTLHNWCFCTTWQNIAWASSLLLNMNNNNNNNKNIFLFFHSNAVILLCQSSSGWCWIYSVTQLNCMAAVVIFHLRSVGWEPQLSRNDSKVWLHNLYVTSVVVKSPCI